MLDGGLDTKLSGYSGFPKGTGGRGAGFFLRALPKALPLEIEDVLPPWLPRLVTDRVSLGFGSGRLALE